MNPCVVAGVKIGPGQSLFVEPVSFGDRTRGISACREKAPKMTKQFTFVEYEQRHPFTALVC